MMRAIVGQQVILGWIQASVPVEPHIILSSSLICLYVHLFYVFFNVLFFCQQNKFSTYNLPQPFSKIYTKNIYLHTFFMRLSCFAKNYCFLSSCVFHIAIRLCELPSQHRKNTSMIYCYFHSIRFLFIPLCCNLTCKYFSPNKK